MMSSSPGCGGLRPTAGRLAWIADVAVWLRGELDREVRDGAALLTGQPRPAVRGWMDERIRPLLAHLDGIAANAHGVLDALDDAGRT